ncbi:MAG: hypothetical protein LIO75_07335 [Lachnospiraceae bacterium]|nr:hypothetical protein [Lachnospiraceae bacterium]
MSPQDKVERVLKEIHVLFSKSSAYNGQPDKIIIDRKEFLRLLDRLNNGIFDMMEQYEQTRQSRQNAERSFRRAGNEIIEKANASADDIYAASVIYTADAIGRIRNLMDETNDSMDDLFRRFRRELREEKDLLKTHETELESQLADLADTRKYLTLLREVNRERERDRERENRSPETAHASDRRYAGAAPHPDTLSDVRVNEEYFEKAGQSMENGAEESTEERVFAQTEKPDIRVNQNAAYFKWKEEREKAEQLQTGSFDAGQPQAEANGAGQPQTGAFDAGQTEPAMNSVLHLEKMEEAAERYRDTAGAAERYWESAAEAEPRGRCENTKAENAISKHTADRAESEVPGAVNAGSGQLRGEAVRAEHPQDSMTDSGFSGADEAESPNPEFPDEAAIYQAVLEDELTREAERMDGSAREKHGNGGLLRTLIFGRDE